MPKKKSSQENKDFKVFLREVVIDIAIVIFLVFFIRAFVFFPFRVSGPSMCNTFNIYDEQCINDDGEYILTSRFATWSLFGWSPGDIERGDVIVFNNPAESEEEFLIKRVIGLAGDTLRFESGRVYLMDEGGEFVELEESYLNENNQKNTQTYGTSPQTYEVPEGHYFVMGDNRIRSNDSRRCFQQLGCRGEDSSPFLAHEAIEGEVKLVIFPLTHMRRIKGYDYGL